jgi:hypothetical protein
MVFKVTTFGDTVIRSKEINTELLRQLNQVLPSLLSRGTPELTLLNGSSEEPRITMITSNAIQDSILQNPNNIVSDTSSITALVTESSAFDTDSLTATTSMGAPDSVTGTSNLRVPSPSRPPIIQSKKLRPPLKKQLAMFPMS